MARKTRWLLAIGVLVVALAVVLAWPPADPLAGVRTVALRTAPGGEASPGIDVAAELKVVLNERDLVIVTDEATADVVLALTDARFDLGDAQLTLQGGKFSGRATAVCRVVDVKTKRVYVMDLILTLRDGRVSASLVGRRFWEFWKPQPTF